MARGKHAFFVKCRPWGVDALGLALDRKIVFVGYPPWKAQMETTYDRHALGKSLFDISRERVPIPASAFHKTCAGRYYRQQVTGNADFAQSVEKGSFVVLPRPQLGLCWIGEVSEGFRLEDDPRWADRFLALARQQVGSNEADDADLIANVAQVWRVGKWEPVPFPLMPRWISYRLLSRTTIGWIPDRPAILEHLVCELLQLENPDERWFHTGGTGDGGADALAVDDSGEVVAILQCKWMGDVEASELGSRLAADLRDHWKRARAYVAVLHHSPNPAGLPQGVALLGRREVAQLLLKHRKECGFARTIGIT